MKEQAFCYFTPYASYLDGLFSSECRTAGVLKPENKIVSFKSGESSILSPISCLVLDLVGVLLQSIDKFAEKSLL